MLELFIMCVIAGPKNYDCGWDLAFTDSQADLDTLCLSEGNGGCTHYFTKKVYLLKGHELDLDPYGYTIFWHEIKHATLYTQCMFKHNESRDHIVPCMEEGNFHSGRFPVKIMPR